MMRCCKSTALPAFESHAPIAVTASPPADATHSSRSLHILARSLPLLSPLSLSCAVHI